MSEPFMSEIRMMSFNFPPKNWALCNGQTMAINQNQALFTLLGTTFGGNGTTTFMLPNLQGRVPNHTGGIGHFLGQAGGEQNHTLSISEMPAHVHVASGTSANGAVGVPSGSVLGAFNNAYTQPAQLTSINPGSIANAGGSEAHPNMQPFLTISFCIALQGIFPSRN